MAEAHDRDRADQPERQRERRLNHGDDDDSQQRDLGKTIGEIRARTRRRESVKERPHDQREPATENEGEGEAVEAREGIVAEGGGERGVRVAEAAGVDDGIAPYRAQPAGPQSVGAAIGDLGPQMDPRRDTRPRAQIHPALVPAVRVAKAKELAVELHRRPS